MRLKNIVIVVKDMEKSKEFYREVFGLQVLQESDGNVILSDGLVLQDLAVWSAAIGKNVTSEHNAVVLYFETVDLDDFAKKLEAYETAIRILAPQAENAWGRKMLRFYDPDGHIIEVAENGR